MIGAPAMNERSMADTEVAGGADFTRVAAVVPVLPVLRPLPAVPVAARRRVLGVGACAAGTALFAGGCAIGPGARAPSTVHDFGLAPAAAAGPARIRASLAVPEAIGPTWIESTSIVYRLLYADGGQPRIYSRSRWAGTPAAMITARLRTRIAATTQPGLASSRDGVQSDFVVRLEIDEFSQVFDTPEQSRGVVRARASLITGSRRATVAQRAFGLERAAPSPDAQGAAVALTEASDRLIDALIDWLAATLPPVRS
jgi:cholesterol transport system auxiliary component